MATFSYPCTVLGEAHAIDADYALGLDVDLGGALERGARQA